MQRWRRRTKTCPLTEAVQMCIVNGNHFDILYLIPWCVYSNNFNGILEQNATLCSSLRMQVIDFKNYLSTESIICWKWNVLHYERLIAVRGSNGLHWELRQRGFFDPVFPKCLCFFQVMSELLRWWHKLICLMAIISPCYN